MGLAVGELADHVEADRVAESVEHRSEVQVVGCGVMRVAHTGQATVTLTVSQSSNERHDALTTTLDDYFRLSDTAGKDTEDFERLVALFPADAVIETAHGPIVHGIAGVRGLFRAFFDRNVELHHAWSSTTHGSRVEVLWAVSGRRVTGEVFALQGTDVAELDAAGLIRHLEVRPDPRHPGQVRGVLARVESDSIDAALPIYERLTGESAHRFTYGRINVAKVGSFLLISGPSDALSAVRGHSATLAVDDIDVVADIVVSGGGHIIEGPADGPNGPRLVARHPDGTVFEYIQPRRSR